MAFDDPDGIRQGASNSVGATRSSWLGSLLGVGFKPKGFLPFSVTRAWLLL